MKKLLVALIAAVIAVALVAGFKIHSLQQQLQVNSANQRPILLQSPQPSGRLGLSFDDKIPAAVQRTVTSRVLPALDQLIGRPWHNLHLRIQVDPAVGGTYRSINFDCQPGSAGQTLTVSHGSDQRAMVGALSLAYQGCFQLNNLNKTVVVGIANAAEILVSDQLKLSSPSGASGVVRQCPRNSEYVPEANNRLGVGVGATGGDSNVVAFNCLSGYLLGSSLASFTRDHPGFLSRWNQALYSEVRQHGLLRAFGGAAFDPLAVGDQAQAGFTNYLKIQHVFDPQPPGPQLFIIAQAHSAHIVGVRRDSDNHQQPLAGMQVELTVEQAGRVRIKGRVALNTDGSYTLDWSQYRLVPGQRVTITARSRHLNDQVSYWPDLVTPSPATNKQEPVQLAVAGSPPAPGFYIYKLLIESQIYK